MSNQSVKYVDSMSDAEIMAITDPTQFSKAEMAKYCQRLTEIASKQKETITQQEEKLSRAKIKSPKTPSTTELAARIYAQYRATQSEIEPNGLASEVVRLKQTKYGEEIKNGSTLKYNARNVMNTVQTLQEVGVKMDFSEVDTDSDW